MFRCKIKTLCRMLVAAVSLLAVLACLDLKAEADEYPNRVVQLIVPYPPGGGVDTEGRVIAQKLSEALAQRVIVVNKPGAGSVIGVRDAAKATPDGYTILMLVTGASLPANTGYDLQKDFEPIGLIASIPIVIMANPSVPVKSMAEVLAFAKKQPGKLTVGTPPAPTLNYFGAEAFKAMAGADMTIVTYKGTGPLTTDLLGGHVMLGFNTLPPAIGNIKAGKIKALAVAAPQRLATIPDVPTTAESGLPGLDIVLYYGLVAPAGTPKSIIERLNKELRTIVNSEDVKQRIIADGGAPLASTPEEYAVNIAREDGRWAALIKKLGLVVN